MKKSILLLSIISLLFSGSVEDTLAQDLTADQLKVLNGAVEFLTDIANEIVQQPTTITGIELALVKKEWYQLSNTSSAPGTYLLSYHESDQSLSWGGGEHVSVQGKNKVDLEDATGKKIRVIITDPSSLPVENLDESINIHYENANDAEEFLRSVLIARKSLLEISTQADFHSRSGEIWKFYIGSLYKTRDKYGEVNDIKDIGYGAATVEDVYGREEFEDFATGIVGLFEMLSLLSNLGIGSSANSATAEMDISASQGLSLSTYIDLLGGIVDFSKEKDVMLFALEQIGFRVFEELVSSLSIPKFIIENFYVPFVENLGRMLKNYESFMSGPDIWKSKYTVLSEFGKYVTGSGVPDAEIANVIEYKLFFNLHPMKREIPGYTYPYEWNKDWKNVPIENDINLLSIIVKPKKAIKNLKVALSLYSNSYDVLAHRFIESNEFGFIFGGDLSTNYERIDITTYFPDWLVSSEGILYIELFQDGTPILVHEYKLNSAQQGIPPSRPTNLIASIGSGNIVNLTWDPSNISNFSHYNIYRDVHSGFSISSDTKIGTSSTENFTDDTAGYGINYFYKVTVIDNDGDESNPSNEVNVKLSDQLIVTAHVSSHEIDVYSNITVTGNVKLQTGSNVQDALILASISELGLYMSASARTDENGNYEISFTSPFALGLFSVRIEAQHTGKSGFSQDYINIRGAPEEGHNLRVSYFSVNTNSLEAGESIIINATVTNDGRYREEKVPVIFRLLDPNQNLVDSRLFEITIDQGYSYGYNNVDLLLPGDAVDGNYTVQVNISLANDEKPSDNRQSRSLFVGDLINFDQYELKHYGPIRVDSTFACGNGYSIYVENISSDNVRVTIKKNDNTIEEHVEFHDNEMKSYENNNFIVILYLFDDDDNLANFYAGTPTSLINVIPGTIVSYVTDTVSYRIEAPSGSRIKETVEIQYGLDSPVIGQWFRELEKVNDLDYIKDLLITIPLDAEIKKYEFWILVRLENYGDVNTWYMKKLFLETKPIHDIVLTGVSISNGYSDNRVGDLYIINGSLQNIGGFYEPYIPLQLEITCPDSTKIYKYQVFSLMPDSSENFEYKWNSAGLIPGTYKINLKVALVEDHNPSNNIFEESVSLVLPPFLYVTSTINDTLFNIADSVIFTATVVDTDSNAITDAKVQALITMPGIEDEIVAFNYDDLEQVYKIKYFPDKGGNYKVIISALKFRHGSSNDTLNVPVKIYVSLEPEIPVLYNFQEGNVDLIISAAGDVYGLATDIYFDPKILRLIDVIETDFLNNQGNFNTSLLKKIDNETGKAIIGLSLLNQEFGVNSINNNSFIKLKFQGVAPGTSYVNLSNTAIIAHDGISTFNIDTTNTFIEVFDFESNIKLVPSIDSIVVNEIKEFNVTIKDVNDLFGYYFEIEFDPNVIEIVAVEEGLFLSQDSLVNTSFLKTIDNIQGILNVACTRLGVPTGVGTMSPNTLFSMKIKGKELGDANFNMKSLNLIAPDGATIFASSFTTPSIVVHSYPEPIRVFIYPDTVYTSRFNTFNVEIAIDSVQNLYGIACDLCYSPDSVQFISITEGDIFINNDNVGKSFLSKIDSLNGRIIIGLSFTEEEFLGISTDTTHSLCFINFMEREFGSTSISLENVGLMGPNGIDRYPVEINNGFVVSKNNPPVILTTNLSNGIEDEFYSDTLIVEDPDIGDTLVFKILTAPEWLKIDSLGILNGIPINDDVGTNISISIKVEDSGGLSDTLSTTIIVFNVNDPPVITSIPDSIAYVDSLYTYKVEAEDIDVGDNLIYYLDVSPFGMMLDSLTGLIEWLPNNEDIGDTVVMVSVRDDSGAIDVQIYTLSVVQTGTTETEIVIPLNEGWTWFSVNVIHDDMTVGNILGSLTTVTGDIIKNQTSFATFYEGFGWWGDLNEVYNNEMYMIKLSSKDTLRFTGMESEKLPIPLNEGWTWIGYLLQTVLSLGDGLQSLSPATGDLIKNQTSFATFYEGFGWWGDLTDMRPFDGYKIKLASWDTLTYPTGIGSMVLVENAQIKKAPDISSEPSWSVNPADFSNTMTMTAQLIIDSTPSTDTQDILGVFVGSECRGVGQPMLFPPTGDYVISLTIYSNTSGETLTFKAFDNSTDQILGITETQVFIPDANVGNAMAPFALNATTTGIMQEVGIPKEYRLFNNYPNPFNPETNIKFHIPKPTFVTIKIYNIMGREVKTVVNTTMQPGKYSVKWDGTNNLGLQVSSGIYIYRMQTGNFTSVKKLTFIK